MIIALSYLMAMITITVIISIARGQHHESREGVEVFAYPVALTRTLAFLVPAMGLLGFFLWRFGWRNPSSAVSATIAIVFGGVMVTLLVAYWYYSSLRIEVSDSGVTVRTIWRTRTVTFTDISDSNLIDGRASHGGNRRLVVYLKNGDRLRFYETLTDFDDLASLVGDRMAGAPSGQGATPAKLKDIAAYSQNKRRETWVLYIGMVLIALAVIIARFV